MARSTVETCGRPDYPRTPLATATKGGGPLERGRASFTRRAWADAYDALGEADRSRPLGYADLELLAVSAQLLGKAEESDEARARAYHEGVRAGDAARAARSALWLGMGLLERGQHAPGLGWISRAAGCLGDRECAERGYLLLPMALKSLGEADHEAAHDTFRQAREIGERFRDADLVALAGHGQGVALVRSGEVTRGMALLDEAMIAVTADELSPNVAGIVYCSVIDACRGVFDLRRAREWTAALSRWCEAQPDLASFRGQCLVRRVEIMRLRGVWPDALDEVRRARERLTRPRVHPEIGEVLYQEAELHRLRGEYVQAEDLYREASQTARPPQPGLALLRLAQANVPAAESAIRRALDEAPDATARAALLPAFVEIVVAAKDISAARGAADELSQLAARLDAPYLRAVSAHAAGTVLLAEGKAREALATLRSAWSGWRELEVPYEAARVRVLVGLACRLLGDADGAEMELDAAAVAFEQLGAVPDRARVQELTRSATQKPAAGLTQRELEVLALVARGLTNRAIAAELFISEKTVARHLSNMFTKLGLASRSAATAYAYEHGLV
ncbi:MAG: LuxR C-terminal-related transcriptional regulator [Candidatus Limnocylindria bacterium]